MRWWLRAAFLSLLAGTGAEGSGPSGAVVGRVGDSAVLGCDLLGARQSRPPLYVIEWVRVGFVLPIFIKFGLYSPRVDPEYLGRVRIEEGASLRIDLLRAEDQGWYECRVLFLDRPSADADFQNGTWIHLTVNAPPTFLETPPAFVEVRDREALSLTCTAVGNPQPVVIWKRSDLAVQSGDAVQVRNGTLSIAVVERASAGTYTCHASSKEGTITHTTRVLVQGPPVIVVPPQNVTVNISQDAFLACQAEAYPGNLTYTWFQGSSNVFHLRSWERGRARGTHGCSAFPSGGVSWPKQASREHPEQCCHVPQGTAPPGGCPMFGNAPGLWLSELPPSHVVSLLLWVPGTSPHAVTNVSVLPLLLAANISWEPGFDGGYFQRFSVWYTPLAKHPPRAHHDWVSLSVPPGAQHLLVENLQPDTSYQFSVLAQNKLGSGPFSQIVTSVPRGFPVTTVPPEPPAMTVHVFLSPPQALSANETSRGVLLRWEPPAQLSVALSGYALELRQDKGGWEVLERSIPGTGSQVLVPGLIKDAFYEFRLVAFAGSYISDPSNTVNVSTAGMEVYPSRTQLPELLPQPVLAGVIGGICFLSVAVIFSTVAACIMNRRRAARIQKRRQDPPLVFSPSQKLPAPPSHGAGSPAGVATKLKLQPSPCPSLRRALLWGEKAGTSLGLSIHGGDPGPLERIRRGPDGRFVGVALRPRPPGDPPAPSGRRRGRYFGYGSSSPVPEAAALCIVDVSPVASAPAAAPPAPSGILQYLSLPFFKEMCDPPQQPPAPPQHPGGGPDCTDPCAKAAAPPAATLLQPPKLPLGPSKASLPGPPTWPAPQEPTHRGAPPGSRTETGDVPPPEKLPRGSLTSQSSGRGSASFLRPPSLAPSLGGPGPGTPPGDGGSWQESKVSTEPALSGAGKRRDTSVDESYEWDAEVTLASDLLAALQLYRAGAPPRPLSTIALRDLERQQQR
uniref:Immunoglobulin superfamily member 9 n=1 Tax=Anas zonorhyncha TaxID=75864 RepID=A0A8B9UTH4_9AVES